MLSRLSSSLWSAGSTVTQKAKENPDTAANLAGDVGGFAQGLGAAAGEGLVGAGTGWLGNLVGGVSGLFSGGKAIYEQGMSGGAVGDIAAGASNILSMSPPIAAQVPLLGTIGGAAQAAGHAQSAYQLAGERDTGWAGNPFWNEVGATGLGAVNAAASLDPTGVSSMIAAGGSAALNSAGALSGRLLGEDYGFSATSAVGAGAHALFSGGRALASGAGALASGLGSALGWVRGP